MLSILLLAQAIFFAQLEIIFITISMEFVETINRDFRCNVAYT